MPNGFPSAPVSKLGLKQGRLNPVLWLTVITLSFLPAGYFFKGSWLVYPLVGLPFGAFTITLLIAWCWAIWKPEMLYSEDYQLQEKLLATLAFTKDSAVPAGEPVVNPQADKHEPEQQSPGKEEDNAT
jgi:hypothetical protein